MSTACLLRWNFVFCIIAGLSLYFEDGHDDMDDFGFDDYSSECDGIRITAFLDAGQDNLTPLGRLEKYAFSDNTFNRQIVARGLLDVLREFSDNENDFISVMETVARMSEDADPTVRAELMEQVPNIAMFLHESRPNFPAAFSRYLVPIVVRYLTDPNNQVRKTSQAALLVLLEQGLICKADMETKVCPVLLDLTEPSSDDDYKIEAVAILCKVVTMLSKDTVEHLLLPRFCDLCSDARLFQVRKVCATNFGEICSIVGQESTEKLLMSKFFNLCSDSLWGIRKACAECFMTVSNSTSPEVRRSKLSPLFINLISDQSRWVRQAAFQSLGRFISTFASPSSTGLHFREDGALPEVPRCTPDRQDHLPFEKRTFNQIDDSRVLHFCVFSNCPLNPLNCSDISGCLKDRTITHTPPNQDGRATPSPEHVPSADGEDVDSFEENRSPVPVNRPDGFTLTNSSDGPTATNNIKNTKEHEQTDENFNSFNYWRPPLPDISEELEMLNCEKSEEVTEKEETEEEEHQESSSDSKPSPGKATSDQIQKVLDCLTPHIADPDVQVQVQVLSAALKAAQLDSPPRRNNGNFSSCRNVISPKSRSVMINESHDHYGFLVFNHLTWTSCLQNVIPQQLLDQYLSMTDPARAQTVDTEIAKHCAFSLPGVALTLGRQNWHCLKDTYETLATDVQWKVRRTLAFSIHELAVILGDQLTAADLVPIFNGFLKDLDEVRIGVLKHLYDFLKLLHADKRREYLYQLQEFMVTDNSRNWRFRYELAEQLILIIELYSHYDVYDYLRQIALTLCSDKVSEVRWISYKLVVEILQKLYACGADDLGLNFINELTVRFCHCPKWVGRQAFAFICQAVVEEDCMPMEQFSQHLLPSLLSLSSDPVANVRVLVAKALRQSVMEKAYFKEPGCAYSDELEETVMTLQSDKDRDVRFFASLDPNKGLMDTTPLI
uniref:WW-binding domain-containing protein n=1 Tax=Nothobranchius furzeri TaxID=105023 RepID=A0A8C6M368_NOTFU